MVVVGRSWLVGMPLAIMLAQKNDRANATVTICHTRTREHGRDIARRADILVAAARQGRRW